MCRNSLFMYNIWLYSGLKERNKSFNITVCVFDEPLPPYNITYLWSDNNTSRKWDEYLVFLSSISNTLFYRYFCTFQYFYLCLTCRIISLYLCNEVQCSYSITVTRYHYSISNLSCLTLCNALCNHQSFILR